MENKFVNGLFSNKREKSPDFVILSQSAKVSEFTKWLEAHQNAKGYANWDVLRSDKGTIYAKLNDWQPKSEETFTKEDGKIKAVAVEEDDELAAERREIDTKNIPF